MRYHLMVLACIVLAGASACARGGNGEILRMKIDVYDGQDGEKVAEDKKVSRGAFTVANLNDTDGKFGVDAQQLVKVTGEKDLFRLDLKQPTPADTPGNIILKIESAVGIETWKSSDKQFGREERRSFSIAGTNWPVTMWVEGLGKSNVLRDTVIKVVSGDPEVTLNSATATFVWAEATGFRNKRTDDLWPEAKYPLRTMYDLHFATLGIVYGGVDIGVMYSMCMEFTVFPPGIGDVSGVKFDVTRQVANTYWSLNFQTVRAEKSAFWPGTSDFNATGPTGMNVDLANDQLEDPPENAINNCDNDNTPENNKIYSLDGPGVKVNDGKWKEFVIRANFLEFVRVNFNGVEPKKQTSEGSSRCSPKKKWHVAAWGERVEIDGKRQYQQKAGKPNEVEQDTHVPIEPPPPPIVEPEE